MFSVAKNIILFILQSSNHAYLIVLPLLMCNKRKQNLNLQLQSTKMSQMDRVGLVCLYPSF